MAVRKASKAPFPYGAIDTCYFVVGSDGIPAQLRSAETVSAAIYAGQPIYGTWPGKSRTDLFIIDEPELLKEALRV